MIERSASMEKLRAMVTLKRLPIPILLLFLLGMGAILTVVKDEVTSVRGFMMTDLRASYNLPDFLRYCNC